MFGNFTIFALTTVKICTNATPKVFENVGMTANEHVTKNWL